jgi:GAF domain-containing protein
MPIPAPVPVPTPAFAPPPPPVPVHAPQVPPAAAAPRSRVRGEDLIADLFEAMHDLHFVRDALEGGEFCLALAMEKLPCQAGIVHLYEIDRREFLITCTRGQGTNQLLLRRHPENEPLLLAAMRKRRALVVADGSQVEGTNADRYTLIGGVRSLLVAPVMLHGRFLGAIELLNPLDGQPFNESEGNALTYIAEQFGEFISSHGIVTDPEKISQRPPQDA